MLAGSDCVAERAPSLATPGGGAAVAIDEVALTLAWNVRGDAAHPAFVDAAARLFGIELPTQPNRSSRSDDAALLWLGPTSWLFIAGRDPVRRSFDDCRHALNEAGAALFDLSSSYIGWSVAGTAAARVLNRGCPLDLHPSAFPAGHCAQSMLGHLTALFHRPDDASAFVVIVARSYARDAQAFLRAAAATDG